MTAPRTTLTTPFVIAEKRPNAQSTSVYLSTLEARIRISRGNTMPEALRDAASLLDVLALSARCEADLIENTHDGRDIVLAGSDYEPES